MKNGLNIVISGAGGQLGKEINLLLSEESDFNIKAFTRSEWDITDERKSKQIFEHFKPNVLINCAAYTQVDLAEEEKNSCFEINCKAVESLAELCADHESLMIHYSTDYVFDGNSDVPYRESDECNALNTYGESKLIGEQIIQDSDSDYLIFRTSWLYSEFGHNFLKTMLKLGRERDKLKVISDQVASPTDAHHLARATALGLKKWKDENEQFESDLFHYTHTGECSWYEYSKEIFKIAGIDCKVDEISTEEYGSSALRPSYSKLNCEKYCERFEAELIDWKVALADCIKRIKENE